MYFFFHCVEEIFICVLLSFSRVASSIKFISGICLDDHIIFPFLIIDVINYTDLFSDRSFSSFLTQFLCTGEEMC